GAEIECHDVPSLEPQPEVRAGDVLLRAGHRDQLRHVVPADAGGPGPTADDRGAVQHEVVASRDTYDAEGRAGDGPGRAVERRAAGAPGGPLGRVRMTVRADTSGQRHGVARGPAGAACGGCRGAPHLRRGTVRGRALLR